jgi:hypothetical protein
MLKQWASFAGWKVIQYFLDRPSARIHVNGLSRELAISPRTANVYLEMYAADGLLAKQRVANASMYSLKNEEPAVNRLKQFYSLATLGEAGFTEKAL